MLSYAADSDRLFAKFIGFYKGVSSFPILVSILIFHVLPQYIEKFRIIFTKKNVNIAESCVDIHAVYSIYNFWKFKCYIQMIDKYIEEEIVCIYIKIRLKKLKLY